VNKQHSVDLSSISIPADVPDDSLDQKTSEEIGDLEKRAKSAPLRDVFERTAHLGSLNRRIEVLQGKLDSREAELQVAVPRVAELEQAMRTARVGAFVESAGAGGGALLLSIASFMADGALKFVFVGAGIAGASLGVLAKIISSALGWPRDRPKPLPPATL